MDANNLQEPVHETCLPPELYETFSQYKFAGPLAEAAYPYFQNTYIFDRWNDYAAECFNENAIDHNRKVFADYMKALINLEKGYTVIYQEAVKLTQWDAGMGGFLSILDIGMLLERQISRNIFGHDDFKI